jgi:hypothetical protein
MDADDLDQGPDLRLGAPQQQNATTRPQPASEQREVDHQRHIGEAQLREVDDDVRLGPDRTGDGPAADALRAPVLVPRAAEDRR